MVDSIPLLLLMDYGPAVCAYFRTTHPAVGILQYRFKSVRGIC